MAEPQPLVRSRAFVSAGLDGVVALDAYNGRELWRYEIPGY